MGAACCKRLEAEPASPHLPICEVIRRCARMICPVDPPQQKPLFSARKLGQADIAGPMGKKDGWAQTDPLPPPRHKRRSRQKRRRSRSVEFAPYLIGKDSRASSASLEDIPHGQEDIFDFQMYFIDRLPNNSLNNGKNILSDKKKEFLTDLLLGESPEWRDLTNAGERTWAEDSDVTVKENSQDAEAMFSETQDLGESSVISAPISPDTQTGVAGPKDIAGEAKSTNRLEVLTKLSAISKKVTGNLEVEEVKSDEMSTEVESKALDTDGSCTSRRSSITESLREFESSLLEMLDEEDLSLKEIDGNSPGPEYEDGILIKMMVPFNKKELPTLVEEREEDYTLSKLDEVDHRESKEHEGNENETNKVNNLEDIVYFKERIYRTSYDQYLDKMKDLPVTDLKSEEVGKVYNPKLKEAPPKITVEIVS